MTVHLDRFEGKKAVLIFENQQFLIDRKLLPKTAKEGDFIDVSFSINRKATFRSLKRTEKLLTEILSERR